MKKKILSGLLAISFSLQATAMAEEYSVFFTDNAEPLQITEIEEHSTGFIPMDDIEVDFEHTKEYIWGDYIPFEPFDTEPLPASYDSVAEGYVTPAKDQGNYGTCWAFATISAMETSMIKNGHAAIDKTDYSERHLAYFAHTRNPNTADGRNISSRQHGYYTGGHQLRAACYLVGWQGTAIDGNYPYKPYGNMITLPESERNKSVAHLQDFYMLTAVDVKSAIMEYGSVVCAYYNDSAYHTRQNAYFQNEKTIYAGNHAVTIVGWDDNYALSNFDGLASKPQNPGAWKVKNSWGGGWGEDGYFWISYEDTSLGDFMAVNAEPADNYQIIHQYDGADHMSGMTVDKSANTFTAKGQQTVEAVGFFTMHFDQIPSQINYTAEVYCLTGDALVPNPGDTPASVQTGTVSYEGYHTIKLDTPVTVADGEKFSVVISLNYPVTGNNAYHVIEGSSNASSNLYESFVYDDNDTPELEDDNWFYLDSSYNNVRIKAYSTVDDVTVSYNPNNGDTITSTNVPRYSLLDIPESPEKSDFYFAGWYKDSSLTEEWSFDTDKASKSITLYAKWSETPIEAESITIIGDEAVRVGDTLSLVAEVEPYYATNKTIAWNSSGNDANVSQGIVTGKEYGDFVITAGIDNVRDTHDVKVREPIRQINFLTTEMVYKLNTDVIYKVSSPNARCFDVQITPNGGSTSIHALLNTGVASGYTYTENQYAARAIAYDYFGNLAVGHTIQFLVTNRPVFVGVTYANAVQVGAYNGNTNSQIILAYYQDGKLEKVELYDKEMLDTMGTVPYDYSYTELKAMWWDSLNTLKPIKAPIIFAAE